MAFPTPAKSFSLLQSLKLAIHWTIFWGRSSATNGISQLGAKQGTRNDAKTEAPIFKVQLLIAGIFMTTVHDEPVMIIRQFCARHGKQIEPPLQDCRKYSRSLKAAALFRSHQGKMHSAPLLQTQTDRRLLLRKQHDESHLMKWQRMSTSLSTRPLTSLIRSPKPPQLGPGPSKSPSTRQSKRQNPSRPP